MGGFIGFLISVVGLVAIIRWIYKKKSKQDIRENYKSFKKLRELKFLLDEGAITQEEFEEQKFRLFKEEEEISKAKANGCSWAIGLIVLILIIFIVLIAKSS
ncbi:SHOCT domain-containing protein [Ornithobacterium rhinotracheale]|uniref:SHOCT domain-containing protein n=1 Tax=Ornithobacterium rhinotracheale TaxID=28251 RepID=UPI003FA44A38